MPTTTATPGTRPAPLHSPRLTPAGRRVFLLSGCRPAPPCEHERAAHEQVARRLAALLGLPFDGAREVDCGTLADGYLVPDDTLDRERAHTLGIRGPHDLFGGVVPHPFVATKCISHPLAAAAQAVPEGWAPELGEALRGIVLPGLSAFSVDDAWRAGVHMLKRGPVRLKRGGGIGGTGQIVAADLHALDQALAALDGAELARTGVAIEVNLERVRTYSVGVVHAGDMRIAYHGTQRLVDNHAGEAVYGGSTLEIVRGGLDTLSAQPLPAEVRLAVELAIRYDAAVSRAYPGLFASRRNYDIAVGIAENQQLQAGVLEQSWRIGGASAAEVLAMEALAREPRLQRVTASTHEAYGLVPVDDGDLLLFRGEDPVVGPLTKHARIVAHGYPA